MPENIDQGRHVRRAISNADLLSDQNSTTCIVEVEKGLQVLEVVCCPHVLQGIAGQLLQHVVPLSQLEHQLWLECPLDVQVQLCLRDKSCHASGDVTLAKGASESSQSAIK